MIVSTKAIVLSAIKYSEADLIVSCFTESAGLKSYLLRNILKSRKGKLRVSHFQLLTQLEISAIHRDKGTLERIQEAKVINSYSSLHTDVVKTGLVMFLAEMLKMAIREEEANHTLFIYLQRALDWLDANDSVANFHILFLLNLTSFLGFYPDMVDSEQEYFNLQEGNFEHSGTGLTSVKGPQVEALKEFFGMDFDDIGGIKLTKTMRSEVLNLLLSYYELHLQAYKKPKSLLVLNQLFN